MDIEHELGGIGIHLFDGPHVAVALRMVVNGNAEFERTIRQRLVKQRIVIHHGHPVEEGILAGFLGPLLESFYLLEYGIGVTGVLLVLCIQIHVDAGHV